MKMKKPEQEILKNFDDLMAATGENPTRQQLAEFLEVNFEDGNELEDWNPTDYKSQPRFLREINDVVVRDFARNLVRLWPILARKIRPEVMQNADMYSLIPVPNGFIIPGGRFREFYYWDSYWIIQGLLISEMHDSAKGMIENFISMVAKYGFIPNGGRIYYLNRSQPPLLTLMAASYFEATKNVKWLTQNIKYFDQELNFWLNKRTISFRKGNKNYTLGHYSSESGTPRPESYVEDMKTASFFEDEEKRARCFSELKSGAETGWDFSSRWIFDSNGGNYANLSYIETSRVIPVDLNAFLCKAFSELSHFYTIIGDKKNSLYWFEKSSYWQNAIENVLWDETDGIWYDYDIGAQKLRKYFFPSNFAPLWTKSYATHKGPELGKRVLEYLTDNKISNFPGGIPTSLDQSGEQWDFPNAWPPLQAIIIQGLERSLDPDAQDTAESLARKWIKANIRGYMDNQEMFEKYDAEHSGKYGGGGEYTVQSGFGWTNGVALELIKKYYTNQFQTNSVETE